VRSEEADARLAADRAELVRHFARCEAGKAGLAAQLTRFLLAERASRAAHAAEVAHAAAAAAAAAAGRTPAAKAAHETGGGGGGLGGAGGGGARRQLLESFGGGGGGAARAGGGGGGGGGGEAALRCPLSGGAMRAPVIAADGYSYERSALREWFAGGNAASPVTSPSPPGRLVAVVLPS